MGKILIIIAIIEFIVLSRLDKVPWKKYKVIAILYIFSVIVNYFYIIKIDYIQQIIENSEDILVERIIVILFSMGLSLIYSPIYTAIIQKIHEKKIIRNSEKYVKVLKYEYYRDILKDVPPAILAYAYNGKINIEDAVIATLLNLQLKGYIKIENNQINILKDIKDLLLHEKLVLEKIDYGKYNKRFFKRFFEENLESDMTSKGYIKKGEKDKANITYFMEIVMGWMIIYILSTIVIFIKASIIGMYIIGVYVVVFLCIPIYKFIQSKINVDTRSQELIELSAKIKGIKNYIQDYSNISNSNIDTITLYEEFVIYAIVLDIKGTLNTECKNMYRNTKNMIIDLEKYRKEKK